MSYSRISAGMGFTAIGRDRKRRKDEKVLEDLSSYALSADGKKVLYKVEKDYIITDATPEKGKKSIQK